MFIYGQRGEQPANPAADLRRYLVDVVGQSREWVEQYAVLPEWFLPLEERKSL